MGNSLFDQLQKAGLVDEEKARKIKQQKYRQTKRNQAKKQATPNDTKRRARQLQRQKANRDRALEQQRKSAAQQKALVAQIRQLITANRIPTGEGEIRFHFVDTGKVRHLDVQARQQQQLVRGQLAIASLDDRYHLLPAKVAEKIRQRDPNRIVLHNPADSATGEDPYADHPVPDDLMW